MKNYFKLTVTLIFSFAVFSFACVNQGTLITASPTIGIQTYKSKGIVRKINAETGELTVDHEDIPGYMSAMEMTEPVKDKAMLENVKVGDEIDFEIERIGSTVFYSQTSKNGQTADAGGAKIYKENCAECHGAKGAGTKKGIPLISGHALHHSEAEYIEQVTNGEGKKMPAFKDKLSDEEIAEVVKFVRTNLQKSKKRTGGHKHSH